jgi:hypothetical protein
MFTVGFVPFFQKSSTIQCNSFEYEDNVPSGGLTLIVGIQNRGFLAKYRADPLWTSSSMKAYRQKTPCGHHVHGRHGHGSPAKNR